MIDKVKKGFYNGSKFLLNLIIFKNNEKLKEQENFEKLQESDKF